MSFAPSGAWLIFGDDDPRLRRGLHSFGASRLLDGEIAGLWHEEKQCSAEVSAAVAAASQPRVRGQDGPSAGSGQALSRQPAEPVLSAVEGTPALPVRSLFAIGVVVGFAGASQRDLVMRELPTLRDWRSLRMGIGLRFRAWMRGFPDIDRLNAVNWSDHNLVL